MTEERCEKCKWWKAHDLDLSASFKGECRIKPPVVVQFQDGDYSHGDTLWPRTSLSDFCGSWEKAAAE